MSVPAFATKLEDYSRKYADYLLFRREDGILEVRMHTNNGPMKWGAESHHVLIPALFDINADPETEVVILTGTGDSFLREFDAESLQREGYLDADRLNERQAYDLFYQDQTRGPFVLLDLRMPVIAAINGPIHFHPELALLNDIVIASNNTYFYENHWDNVGLVPGDGVHTLFRELLGHNRGRYFLLMGQKIEAEEALRLGLIGEVVSPDELLPRAWEIARKVFMSKDRIHRRLTRSLLIQPWRELFTKELFSGMAHESFACMARWPRPRKGQY